MFRFKIAKIESVSKIQKNILHNKENAEMTSKNTPKWKSVMPSLAAPAAFQVLSMNSAYSDPLQRHDSIQPS